MPALFARAFGDCLYNHLATYGIAYIIYLEKSTGARPLHRQLPDEVIRRQNLDVPPGVNSVPGEQRQEFRGDDVE